MNKPLFNQALLRRIEEIDWDFSADRSVSKFSTIHWHPCRFVSQIPAAFIGLLTSRGDTVLDPFLGSGTTVFEAQRLQRRGIGIEINPIAVEIAKAKTLAIDAREVKKIVNRIRVRAKGGLSINQIYEITSTIPETVQLEKWYNKTVRNDLIKLWSYVSECKDEEKIISDAIFSAVLLKVCRETRHWGYVCDNSTPQGNYGRVVLGEFDRDLTNLVEAYVERDKYILRGQQGKFSTAQIVEADIICGDARNVSNLVAPESIDLVVTSPPYFGVTDYVKAQRLSFEWEGRKIEPYRLKEIGARSKRHRKQAKEQYLSDLEDAFCRVRLTLKHGAPCVVVFGESASRAPMFELFVEKMEEIGFDTQLRLKRTISHRRRQAPSLSKEHLLVFV